MRLFVAASAAGASRCWGEPDRLKLGRATSVRELTNGRQGSERRAQPSERRRGSGGGGESAAEVELGEGLVGSIPGGGDHHLLGSDAEVVENAAGDHRIGDEREHAQMIAAARSPR